MPELENIENLFKVFCSDADSFLETLKKKQTDNK